MKHVNKLNQWNNNKKNKINKMIKDSAKHKFKPEINPVSKIITQKDTKDSSLNKSSSSELLMIKNLVNISVHDKLYLSRNNSHGLLPSSHKSCKEKPKNMLESRSNSVNQLKTYCSPMPRIQEARRMPLGGSKSKKSLYSSNKQSSNLTPKYDTKRYEHLYNLKDK